jgi:membrane-associated phospholipid phosphatase
MEFNVFLFAGLCVACILMMIAERRGAPVVLTLRLKNDIKRETRFLQQYGQFTCCTIVVAIVFCLGGSQWRGHGEGIVVPLAAAPLVAGGLGMFVKRLLSRVRPGHENAGKFLGPTKGHANFRESFPSNHSATAMALSVGLSYLYPPAAIVFWTLAVVTGLLRYLLDAHWPSDVLGGLAFGYVIGWATWHSIAAMSGFAL